MKPDDPEDNPAVTPPVPRLSPQEFRVYNRMAETMEMMHDHFRQTWRALYHACKAGEVPAEMSQDEFLGRAEEFCHHLTVHHAMEERHVFPVLARRMEDFGPERHLLTQHEEIHEGVGRLEGYVGMCRSGEKELRWEELKGVMDGVGEVLWRHLDEEVAMLGAENMMRFWTVEEMGRMPM